MVVHNIANKAEFDAIKNDKDIIVIDFMATWCGPCKVVSPVVAKLSDEFNQVHFIKVDVDEVPDLAQEYGIRAMPTFKIIKKGEVFDEVVGANPPAIKAAIEKAVA